VLPRVCCPKTREFLPPWLSRFAWPPVLRENEAASLSFLLHNFNAADRRFVWFYVSPTKFICRLPRTELPHRPKSRSPAQNSDSVSREYQQGSPSDRSPSRTSKSFHTSREHSRKEERPSQRLAPRQSMTSFSSIPTKSKSHFPQRLQHRPPHSMALPDSQFFILPSAMGSGEPCVLSPAECKSRAKPSFESPSHRQGCAAEPATGTKRKREMLTASGEKCSSTDTDNNVGTRFEGTGEEDSAARSQKKARLIEPAPAERKLSQDGVFSMAGDTTNLSCSPPPFSVAATIQGESLQVVQRWSEHVVAKPVVDASHLDVVFELVLTSEKRVRNFVCCSLSPAFVIFLAHRAGNPSQKVFVKFMPYDAPSMGFKSNLRDLMDNEVTIPSSFTPFFHAHRTESRVLSDAYNGIQYLLNTDSVCYSMKSFNVVCNRCFALIHNLLFTLVHIHLLHFLQPMLVSISEASPLCEPTLVPIEDGHPAIPDLKAMVLAAQIVKAHGFQHQHKLTPHMHKLRAVARMYVVRQLLEAAAFLNSQGTWLGCVNVLDLTIFDWKHTHEPTGGEKIAVPIIKVARRWRTDDVTAANVAPEMNEDASIQPTKDGKVDAFAIGCILFTLITLVLPSNDPELICHGFPLRFDCDRLDEYFCDPDGAFTVEAFMLHDLTQVNPKYRLSPADVLRKYAKYLPTFP
jgi:hypothetical protein